MNVNILLIKIRKINKILLKYFYSDKILNDIILQPKNNLFDFYIFSSTLTAQFVTSKITVSNIFYCQYTITITSNTLFRELYLKIFIIFTLEEIVTNLYI